MAAFRFRLICKREFAHENDAERAARAALAIQRALTGLNRKNADSGRPELAARIGLEFGPAVVDTGGEIYGDVANVAARVQALAEPGAIMITADANIVETEHQWRGQLDLVRVEDLLPSVARQVNDVLTHQLDGPVVRDRLVRLANPDERHHWDIRRPRSGNPGFPGWRWIASMRDQGWEAVPPSRHPNWLPQGLDTVLCALIFAPDVCNA
jgi:Adenylate and Guanylate cyclase catalytic domain